MVHPLVEQARFAREELVRSLAGVSEDEAAKRFMPMNCISWIVGHLADQEQRYWLIFQGRAPVEPNLNALVGHGNPASTPSLHEMWMAWRAVTAESDAFLARLGTSELLETPAQPGRPAPESNGTLLQRVIHHYWFHIGETQAIRQLLGHQNLPQFVGDIGAKAPYRPDN